MSKKLLPQRPHADNPVHIAARESYLAQHGPKARSKRAMNRRRQQIFLEVERRSHTEIDEHFQKLEREFAASTMK